MNIRKVLQFVSLVTILIMTSCASRKDFIYLQDMDELHEYPVIQKYEAIIHRDDKLSITVNSKNPELALPFNMGSSYTIGADGNIISTPTAQPTSGSGKDVAGYLVDVAGDIDFPVLGKLHVEGMTRAQLTTLIKKRLVEEGHIANPIVTVNFLNFKFSVLGEVNGVGTYEITGDRITLLEAIAMAGDLRPTARLDRIGVIREYGNKRRILFHDIRSKDIFTSPCYYLQQNDIVYVEPTRQKADERDQRNMSRMQMILSFITSLTSIILIATN
ncbi:MAG: polysaccharide biosynthesis/export family protein [Bacteroidaceae bacterium]|nr:polysaccharide biosynthesis/export family protein [Bacteroidaceae bacterium]